MTLQILGLAAETIQTIHFMAGMYLVIIPIIAYIDLKVSKSKLRGALYGLSFALSICAIIYM